MKTCSKTVLLFTALSVSAFLSGQTFAEGVVMIGANLIAYHGAETTAVASAEATGASCANASTKRGHSNFNPGAIGLLSARSSC